MFRGIVETPSGIAHAMARLPFSYNPERYMARRIVRKQKKEREQKEREEARAATKADPNIMPYYSDWEPYEKLKPYTMFKVFLLYWLPVSGYLVYGAFIGDFWPEVDPSEHAFGIPLMIGIIAVPFYHVIAPIHINLISGDAGVFSPTCPECGYTEGDPLKENLKSKDFFVFCWDRVLQSTCPECKFAFEIESMAPWDYPYDDEPIPGRKYGDPSLMRIKPKIPFRLGPFVLKSNPDHSFRTPTLELYKVIPVLLVIYGLQHLVGAPEWLDWGLIGDLLFAFVILGIIWVVIWTNPFIQEIRKGGQAIAEDILVEMEIVEEDYKLPWYLQLIVTLSLVAFALVTFFLFPDFF